MKKIVAYKIVFGHSVRTVEHDANTLISEGFQPEGPLMIKPDGMYVQLMVKREGDYGVDG